ncbi:MAG TPA: proline--tRNA ligase [Bacteroidetes bacterium]|nr:proline--tRNA ligase [Bacteroidota bacterium]
MAKKLPKRAEEYSLWYNELVKRADLAQHSATRGSMVIKPYGFSIWEAMQQKLDKMFKDTGHVNAYFPLLIPKSFLSREAEHVEGFAMECAVVTHHRLTKSADGKELIVDPTAKLEEEYIIRPTSETIIWNTYKDWIQSYRDLPLLINQWANVMRWEMKTRLFLRTAEFLWQEGHTAHATKPEAVAETMQMLDIYATFSEEFLAMPVIRGVKPEHEKFPGAEDTYTIEAMMQDRRALQAGTSHFLGQKFAKAFDVTFLDQENQREHVWATSWGVSTRLVGALIMAHSDDEGLVLPPTVAPIQVVIIPLGNKPEDREPVLKAVRNLEAHLVDAGIRVKVDDDDTRRPGWKFAEWELKGVPVRIVLGKRDLENKVLEIARRDTKEKASVPMEGSMTYIQGLLAEIQSNLLERAKAFRKENSHVVDSYEELKSIINGKGGFVYAHWDGTTETANKIKEETKATIRCIPLEAEAEAGVCVYSGKPSKQRVIFAKSY